MCHHIAISSIQLWKQSFTRGQMNTFKDIPVSYCLFISGTEDDFWHEQWDQRHGLYSNGTNDLSQQKTYNWVLFQKKY